MNDESTTPKPAPVKELVSIHDVAIVTSMETREVLETFATQIEPAGVPAWLARTTELIEWLGIFKKFLEVRILTDEEVQKILSGLWTDPDTKKVWQWSGRHSKGWKDIANTIEQLFASGLSTRTILEAISEVRVTDLREAADTIKDEKKRKAILEIIEEGRGEGDGPKHLRVIR